MKWLKNKFSALKEPVDLLLLLCKGKKKVMNTCKRSREKGLFRRFYPKGRVRQTGARRKPQFEHLTKHSNIGQTLASRCSAHTRPGQRKLNIKIAEAPGKTSQRNLLFGSPTAVLTGASLLLVTII